MADSQGKMPPKFVGRLLEVHNQLTTDTRNDYEKLLLCAERAMKDAYDANISIRASFKTTTLNKKHEEVGFNDTLLHIFAFYAKIIQRATTTFSAAEEVNKTINFKKMEIFCRDFNLVPKLLNRDDLKFAWELQQADRLAANKGMLIAMNFDDFKEFLVRLAIVLYHKPGLKKLILTMEGFMPKNSEIVDYLCTYLHLHDLEWVMCHLRTVGRKTQGDYNFRSKGEKNARTQKEIASNAEAKQLRQVNTGQVRNVTKTTVNAFGEKVVEHYECLPASTDKVIRSQLLLPTEEKKTGMSGKKFLSESLQAKLWDTDDIDVMSKYTGGNSIDDAEEEHTLDNDGSTAASMESPPSSPGVRFRMPTDILSSSTGSSLLPVFIDNSVETLKSACIKDYDKILIQQLFQYSYRPPKVQESDVIETGGPVVDLGLVGAGTKISISLCITNAAGDVKNVDVMCRDFLAADTQIITHSKPLIAGFSRKLLITFTPEPGRKTVLAFIDVVALGERKGASCIVKVPVFYRVDPAITKDDFPRCTAGSLSDLMGQYFPDRQRYRSQNFEKILPAGASTWPRTIELYK
jgi:hypothetical protein